MARENLSEYTFTGRGDMFDIVVRQFIAHLYENAESDADKSLIEEAYKKHTGFNVYIHPGQPNQIGIFGPPAHGKSSVLRAAVEHVAGLLDKKFVEYNLEAIAQGATIDQNTIVYMNAYLAGKQSPAAITGIQVPRADGSLDTMLPIAYQLASKAFGGYVTFEDVTAAPPQVQTALHMLLDEHVPSEWLRRIAFSVTGNLGKADKTAASDVVSSIATRLEMHYMRTTEAEYIDYVTKSPKFDGENGDGFLLGFMNANPAFFEDSSVLKDRLNAKYCAPRTMDQAIAVGRQEMGAYLAAASSKNSDVIDRAKGRMLSNLGPRLQGTVGKVRADEMVSYYNLVLSLAFPIVNELVEKGELSPDLKAMCDEHLNSDMSPKTIGFINGLQDYSARVIGKGLSEAILTGDDAARDRFIKAWNTITFDIFSRQDAQHQNVRRTYWKLINSAAIFAEKMCNGDKEKATKLAGDKVGYLSKVTGMVMNTDLVRHIAASVKDGREKDQLRYASQAAVDLVFSDLCKTTTQLKKTDSELLDDFANSIG